MLAFFWSIYNNVFSFWLKLVDLLGLWPLRWG